MTNKPQFVGEKVRVSDVFDLRMGKTPSRKNLSYWHDGNHDWISIADLGSFGKYVGSTKERINDLAIAETGIKPAPANTVLMSFKLSLGKTAITTIPVYTNEAIMAFVDKGVYPVDPSFMYHQCRAKDWTADTNTAVMGKTLNKKTLGQQMVFLPGLAEQKAIARQLDFVERQLVNANEQLEQLDSLVKSRFVEMFGDPDSNPHGLEVCPLGKVLSVQPSNGMYKPHKDYVSDGSGTPIIRIDSFRNEGPDYSSLKRLNCNESECRRYGINENDIVINRVNSVGCMGKTMLVSHIPEVTVFESNMMRLHSDEALMIPAFLCAQMTSEFSKSYFEANAKRAIGQASINQKDVKGLPVLVPTIGNQKKYLSFVAEVDKSRFVDLLGKGHEFLLGLDISKRKLDRGKLLCVDVRLVDSAFCHTPKERLGGA